jgi:L-arabinonolactonase
MTRAPDIRVLHNAPDTVGESPLWDAARECVWWVDAAGHRINRLDWETGAVVSTAVSLPPGALFLSDSGLIVAAGTGWHRLTDDGLHPVAAAPVAPGGWRMNDGCTDAAGRIWTGSVADPLGSGAGGDLFCLGPRGAARVLGGLGVQNGTAVSPCGRHFYLSDTAAESRTIWRFDLDDESGALANRRVFHRCETGRPDGGATDAEGCYWFAAIDAGRIVRLDPDGREMAHWLLPASRPTKIAFCGADLGTLVITTMRAGLGPAELAAQPEAGALLAFEAPVPGWALPRATLQDTAHSATKARRTTTTD